MGIRALTIITLIFCLSASLPAMAVERNVERSFNVKRGGTLNLDSDLGSVIIKSHAQDTVHVKVELVSRTSSENRAEEIFDNFKLDFNSNDKDVIITGDIPRKMFWNNYHLSVRFEITVPEQYNLDIKTRAGNIEVGDVKGQVGLATSGGRINLGNVDGAVTAKSSGGSIYVKDVNGDTNVYTSGGDIRVGTVKGNLTARTSGGNIDVNGVEGDLGAHTSGGDLRLMNVNGNLTGNTSGGTIVAQLTKQVDSPVELRSSGGSIKLTVPKDFKADLRAATSGGNVYTDIPISVTGKINGSSLNGKLNGGGPNVTLKTSGGNIEITLNEH